MASNGSQKPRRRPPIIPFRNLLGTLGSVKSTSVPVLAAENAPGVVFVPCTKLEITFQRIIQVDAESSAIVPLVRAPTAKANCTHTIMKRIHGNHKCWLCGQVPNIGWVYVCEQDQDQSQLLSRNALVDSHGDIIATGVAPKRASNFEESTSRSVIDEFAALNFHRSVLNGAQQGVYSSDQLAKLIAQKKHMREVIEKQGSRTYQAQPCQFQCCHSCRQYYKDRCFMSFDAVFANEIEPITSSEYQNLPVRDVKVLRNIGLAVSPSNQWGSSSFVTISTTPISDSNSEEYALASEHSNVDPEPSSVDMPSPLRRIRSTGRQLFFPDTQLKRAIAGLKDGSDSSQGRSNVTLPLERTGTLRGYDEAAKDFDVSLFRDVNRAENLVLPHLPNLQRQVAKTPSRQTLYGDTQEGEEVEVEGGVALMEEAVETGVPDILTHC